MGMVSWFGVSIASSERLVDALIRGGVRTFAIINFGKGLIVGVDKRADEFVESVAALGGRATPLSSVELPPARPLRLHAYPVDYALAPRGGVVARRAGAQRFIAALYKAWGFKPPRAYEDYVFSATRYGVVFKAFVFGFDRRGNPKLSRKVLRLKVPLLVRLAWTSSLAALTPLDLVNLTSELVRGGAYIPRSRFAEVVERAWGFFEVPVAEGLVLGFKEGEDRSMLVIGAPGTGKSLFMDYVLENVRSDVNVIVLDPTGEHAARLAPPPPYESGWRVLVAGRDYMLNPVSLPNAYDVLYYTVGELWREGLRAFPAEVLYRSLEGARTLLDVVRNVEALMKSSTREDVVTGSEALLRRLRPLIHPALLGGGGLPEGRVVIDLGWIDAEEARRAFVLTFLYSVYFAARRGEWSGIIVIDEADRYAGEAADWVADELRKYGVSIWAVGHSVERVPGRLRDARYTFIFATKDPENLAYAREVFPREVVEKLPYLSFGQAAFQERGRQPMIVSVHLSRGGFYARRAGAGLREIALKYGLSEYTLSVEFAKNQDVRDIILRATSGAASPEDYRKLREKGLDPVKDAKLIYALGELYSSQGGSRGGA
jgi:hypothetical protein